MTLHRHQNLPNINISKVEQLVVADLSATSEGVYFTDEGTHSVNFFDVAQNKITQEIGSGEKDNRDGVRPLFVQPSGICFDGNSMSVVDIGAKCVKVVSPTAPQVLFL